MRNGVGNGLKDIEKLIRQFAFPNGINKFYAFKYGKGNKLSNQFQRKLMDGIFIIVNSNSHGKA